MSKWTRRVLIAVPALAIVATLGAPFLSANLYKAQVQQNLERVLGRRVEVQGEARFQLYPRPGVSLGRVVIHELPALGVEPVAYLDYPESSLDVSLSPLALLTGRVKVTGVRLVSPSLNLSKSREGVWNLQALLDRAKGEGFELDGIAVQGGRLNFKIDGVKSVFYLTNADLRFEADAANRGRYGITFEGDPARTDRTSSSFGRLSGRGMLTLGQGGRESRIDLSMAIDRTPIAELATAFEGRGVGLGGFVASQAKLNGPLSAVAIDGRIELNDAERFRWLLPRALSARGLGYSGLLDWPGQEFRLSTHAPEAGVEAPFSLRLRAFDLFRQPRWAALLGIDRAPLASIRALAGDLAVALPSETPVEGALSGVLGYSSRYGAKGQLAMAQAAVPVPDMPQANLASARVLVDNHRWSVPATEIRFSDREAVTVETSVDSSSGAREVGIASAGLAVERSRQLWKFLAGGAEPPFFDRCRQGNWAGSLRFVQDARGAGQWSGGLLVTGAVCQLEGIAEAVRIYSAQVALRGQAMTARRVMAQAGQLAVTGEVDYDPARRRPVRLRLAAAEASAAEVERLLLPALRRQTGFLSRTLGRRAPLPEWLRDRKLDAQLRIGTLAIGEQRLEGLDARVAWDGATIDVEDIAASFARGLAKGRFRISLAAAEPSYKGRFTMAGATVRDGKLDGEAEWETAGAGASLAAALQAQGAFTVRGAVLLAAEPPLESAAGSFAWSAGKLQLSSVQAMVAGETLQGQGAAAADGKVALDLGGPARPLRASGRLW